MFTHLRRLMKRLFHLALGCRNLIMNYSMLRSLWEQRICNSSYYLTLVCPLSIQTLLSSRTSKSCKEMDIRTSHITSKRNNSFVLLTDKQWLDSFHTLTGRRFTWVENTLLNRSTMKDTTVLKFQRKNKWMFLQLISSRQPTTSISKSSSRSLSMHLETSFDCIRVIASLCPLSTIIRSRDTISRIRTKKNWVQENSRDRCQPSCHSNLEETRSF